MDDFAKQLRKRKLRVMSDAYEAIYVAADRIEALEGLLDLYRDAVMIDATMDGPKFKGANSSALKRAWFHDCAALAGEKKDG